MLSQEKPLPVLVSIEKLKPQKIVHSRNSENIVLNKTQNVNEST